MILFFQDQFIFFIILIVLFGLCVGSFLNVVIYRLPIILTLHEENEGETICAQSSISLIKPRSHCPNCKQTIPWYFNIPLLGFFISGRTCCFCAHKISFSYPVVEFLSGLLAGLIACKWGVSIETLGALIFTWILIPLVFIDIQHQLLPDSLNLLGLWLGLFANLFHAFTSLDDAVIGAISGYLSLWLIAQTFRFFKKKDGMGYGDFKLFAMLGAWLGWAELPFILLQASLVGLLISLIMLWLKRKTLDTPVPFGPYLAISGWITLYLMPT